MDFLERPEDIDKFVCTEVSEAQTSWGRDLVRSNMIHSCGPFCYTKHHNCGGDREKCKELPYPCRKDFAKPPASTTTLDGNTGNVTHRRREEEDRLVVEFNEELLRIWQGHCNVKSTSTATIISYLFGYCFKGNDRAEYILQKQETGSALEAYKKARYLSSMEACWRAFSYENCTIRPKIHILNLTIPYTVGGQVEAHRKKITKTKNARKAEERGTLSQIGAWFYRPEQLDALSFSEFHEQYGSSPEPFKKKNLGTLGTDYFLDNRPKGSWYVRKHPLGPQLFRFYDLHPYHGAAFYLMLLLKHHVVDVRLDPSESVEDGYRRCLHSKRTGVTYTTYEEFVRAELPATLGDEGPVLYFQVRRIKNFVH